jgi:hypothetical protein
MPAWLIGRTSQKKEVGFAHPVGKRPRKEPLFGGVLQKMETGSDFGFSRTFDGGGPRPVPNDRKSPRKRGRLCCSAALDHQECGRTRIQQHFQSFCE